MKLLFSIILFIALLYTSSPAQRRPTEYLRETDNSRKREVPSDQNHQRPVDPGGKERTIPKNQDVTPVRQPIRYIDKPDPQETPCPEPAYSDNVVVDIGFYLPPDEPFYPAPEIIYTSEKEEALELINDENYFFAIKKLTISIVKNPKDLELYYLRGIARSGATYYDDAILDFDYYLKFFDEDGEAYYRRGLAKFFNHQKQEALKDLELAVIFEFEKANQIIKRYYQ